MSSELEKVISDVLFSSLKSLCDEEGPGAYFSLHLILKKMAEVDGKTISEYYDWVEISEIDIDGNRGYRLSE